MKEAAVGLGDVRPRGLLVAVGCTRPATNITGLRQVPHLLCVSLRLGRLGLRVGVGGTTILRTCSIAGEAQGVRQRCLLPFSL